MLIVMHLACFAIKLKIHTSPTTLCSYLTTLWKNLVQSAIRTYESRNSHRYVGLFIPPPNGFMQPKLVGQPFHFQL